MGGKKKKKESKWMVIARLRDKERGNGRREEGKREGEFRETIFQSSVITFFLDPTG